MSTTPDPPGLNPALAIAVAVTTAAGVNPPVSTAEELVGDVDPIEVIRAFGVAWSATLRVILGEEGRSTALQGIGLAAAEERP